ncbi:MAG: P22 phage major capsid protein family protein [Acidobacteriaceae bacterium]
MPNTLTNLIPTIYEALDTVSREMIGFIPAVAKDTSAERAALGQQILVPVTQAQAAQNITPGVVPPDTGDQTIGNVPMTIQNSMFVPIRWNGEQQKGFKTNGTYDRVLRDQFAQGFRTLANLVETACFQAAYQGASRAYGTPGTAPFGTAGDLSASAQVRKILDDNGAPQSDLHLVLGSGAVANLRGLQTILLKANEEGSNEFRRTGQIAAVPLDGFMLHNSNSIKQVTKGTGASYVTSGDSPAGTESIALVTGSGTVLAGDVATFAADANNKYVVNTGVTAPGTIVIGNPGTLVDVPTGNALTIGSSYTPNVGFHRNALQLITRAPAMPEGPDGRAADLAEDTVMVTDPVSGISFEVSMYRQFRQVAFYVALAWGVTCIKGEHVAVLQG